MGSPIDARGVTRSFATDGGVRIEVLRGVDLSVPAGGSTVMAGEQ